MVRVPLVLCVSETRCDLYIKSYRESYFAGVLDNSCELYVEGGVQVLNGKRCLQCLPFVRFRVLGQLGARALSVHVRVFADYLVYELSKSVGGKHVNKVCLYLFSFQIRDVLDVFAYEVIREAHRDHGIKLKKKKRKRFMLC